MGGKSYFRTKISFNTVWARKTPRKKVSGKLPTSVLVMIFFFGFDTKSKGTNTKNKQAGLHQTKKLLHTKGNHPQIQIRQIQIKTTMRHHLLEWLLSKR